jgi:predicted glycoside hydrolase/deacetylase ChbG (UPF0249 family)
MDGFKNGIVTSASICVNGRAFEEAVYFCKQNPGLDIGLHITLIDEEAISKAEEIRSLVESGSSFYKNTITFLRRYFLGRIDIKDIEKEARAQIEKALSSGLLISHLDSHRHLHLLPGIRECFLSLAKEYKIPYVRCGLFYFSSILSLGMLKCALLNVFCKPLKIKLSKNCIATSERVIGVEHGGHLTKLRLLSLLASLPDGVTELVCHPGSKENYLDARYKRWGYNFEEELKALLSIEVSQSIKRKGIVLTSFSYLNNTLSYGS